MAAPPVAAAGTRAELPRVFLDTHYVPPAGQIIRVRAGEDLQRALDAAQPGDRVMLDAGATYTGNFVLPKKVGDAPIVVRPGASSECRRVGASGLRTPRRWRRSGRRTATWGDH